MSALLQTSLFGGAPPRAPVLRPYQLDAVERIRVEIRRGRKRVLVVAPTGAGKTIIFSDVILKAISRGSHVLVIAHRIELINQTVDKLIEAGVDPQQIGVIRANDSRRNPRALVQVASVDTLRNRKPLPQADLVVIDECHRALSKSYAEISKQYPDAIHLGFTATPWRLDGRGLGRMYEALVVVATVQALIDAEFLVQPLVYSHPDRADLSDVRAMRGGDYAEDELAIAVDKAPLIGSIVEHWRRHADGLRTLAFAASVAHSQHIRDAFLSAGIAAEHVDGTTPEGERKGILHRFRSGRTLVVCNMGVLTEGFDEPLAKCCVLARPTKSRILYFQCIGRVLRAVPGRPDLTSAIVLDHAGCALEHGLPEQTTEDEYTLDDEERGKRREVSVKWCEQCFRMAPGGTRVCPHCGAAFAVKPRGPANERLLEEASGELVLQQKEAAQTAEMRSEIQQHALRIDRERGWDFGETNRRLLDRYRKPRTKMGPLELRAVLSYLTAGGFAADNPAPRAPTLGEPSAYESVARTAPVAIDTPAWLATLAATSGPCCARCGRSLPAQRRGLCDRCAVEPAVRVA